MNRQVRFLTLVAFNLFALLGMLAWSNSQGIDLENSTIAQNLENIGFAFDLLSFLAVNFCINFAILVYPSEKKSSISKLIRLLHDIQERQGPPKKHIYRKRNA